MSQMESKPLNLLTQPCFVRTNIKAPFVAQATAGDDDRLLGYDIRSDGDGYKSLKAPLQCTPAENAGAPPRGSFQPILMNGREVFKFAVKAVPQTVSASLEEAGLLTDDIDWLVLHQVSRRR